MPPVYRTPRLNCWTLRRRINGVDEVIIHRDQQPLTGEKATRKSALGSTIRSELRYSVLRKNDICRAGDEPECAPQTFSFVWHGVPWKPVALIVLTILMPQISEGSGCCVRTLRRGSVPPTR